ncbi:hypothetical protein FHR99_000443 [Litorivivens lipolytica]|uniref:NAD/FAD-utilizing enzyme apparently involved in cell division n=1 Tax=Litorivivens lipolytica TaxID=1524264 RepID=A0A7W4W2F4_9GAMM|nr:hypothetical protein [Litorivivens lipolytica]MBB3046207.1 hypothetical protein [Litorivivens lipolytica]
MKRLFYLTESADFAGQVAKQLVRVPGFSPRRLHVIGKDLNALYERCLPVPASCLQKDFLRGAEYGALLGGAFSVLLLVWFWFFAELPASALNWLLLGVSGGLAVGCAFGWSRDNALIRHFHEDLVEGKFLLIVDVTALDESAVRRLLAHLPIEPAGESRALVPALI